MPSPSLDANYKPSWPVRLIRSLATLIDPEIYEQGQIIKEGTFWRAFPDLSNTLSIP
jgi:hypothetical protein